MSESKNRKHGERSFKASKTGQQAMLIALLLNHFGGSAKSAKKFSEKLGERVTRQMLLNWVNRGYVPLKHSIAIGRIVKATPYALNYRHYSVLQREAPPWKEVVMSIKILPLTIKTEICKKKAPKV